MGKELEREFHSISEVCESSLEWFKIIQKYSGLGLFLLCYAIILIKSTNYDVRLIMVGIPVIISVCGLTFVMNYGLDVLYDKLLHNRKVKAIANGSEEMQLYGHVMLEVGKAFYIKKLESNQVVIGITHGEVEDIEKVIEAIQESIKEYVGDREIVFEVEYVGR